MVSVKSQARWRAELAAGKRPKLTRADFDPSLTGAFDEMTPELRRRIAMDRRSRGARDQEGELPAHIARQVDVLSDGSARQLHQHLSRRFARDRDLDGEEDDIGGDADPGAGDLGSQILDFLHDAGVDPKICERVKALLDAGNGDDQVPAGEPSSGYDPTNQSADAMVGADEPPPFRGAPQAPYTSPGDAERHAALENMKRVRSFTPADLTYKDGTPNGDQYIHGARLRRPAGDAHQRGHRFTGAMDSAAAKEFADRWPEIARACCEEADHDFRSARRRSFSATHCACGGNCRARRRGQGSRHRS
jgi:hypothetical protein